MFLSEWREFLRRLALQEKKTWWQLASRCCWNRACPWHASELVSFLVGLRTYQHFRLHFCFEVDRSFTCITFRHHTSVVFWLTELKLLGLYFVRKKVIIPEFMLLYLLGGGECISLYISLNSLDFWNLAIRHLHSKGNGVKTGSILMVFF